MNGLKRILLAEDDPRDVELTLTALASHKLANEVEVVRDGAEALDYLRRTGRYASRPDSAPAVVLLDLKMPKVSGLEVLKAIKGDPLLANIPIVILTSSREARDLKECYDLGVNAYVVKPVKFNEFLEAIARVGVFWALVNTPPIVNANILAREDERP